MANVDVLAREMPTESTERLKTFEFSPFNRAKKDSSGRMKSVERMCVKIELLRDFNVFHSQSNYLVQIISKGIQEVKETYSLISKEETLMLLLYLSNKLSQLISSLDSLLRDLMLAERLLQACGGKKWKRAAIVLSMPPPEWGKYTGSSFFLLIRDFNWSLDTVRHSLNVPCYPTSMSSNISYDRAYDKIYTLKCLGMELTVGRNYQHTFQFTLPRHHSGDEWEFKWCHRRCRYKLQRNVHASEHKVESLKADFDRQAQDRKNLPGVVEKNLTARAHGSSFSASASQLSCNSLLADETLASNKLLAVVKNRCQDTSSSGSANLVSKRFEIDNLDLKMGKNHISDGASKRIFRANWLGQEVAVAVVKHIPRDVVEKEAGFLVKVHHPNVVDFFGFALKEEALTEEEMAAVEKIEPKWTGYLVMELMQEDLRSLIEKLLRGTHKQEYGGPFSLSITVDLLLQIVGAMIHTHKFDILHRDLKAKNCLVSPKPVSSSKALGIPAQYYTVKLIDFGESKLWAKDGKQTLKKGTIRWMAPEVWESSEYSKSADVYSFGMTCYEVVTGLIPFQGIPHRIMEKVLEGIRPTIPGTCPQSLSDLMKKCWAHAPEDRPTFEEIQKDLWAIKYSVDVPIQF